MDTRTFRRHVRAGGLALLLGLCAALPDARASSFTVNPTQLHLAGRRVSALMTLRNEGDTPLRFQLSVFSWTQKATGDMQLEPTQDIVFFPALLTLGPKEERRIRVGGATAFGPVERTYRIFVEELPPDSADGQDRYFNSASDLDVAWRWRLATYQQAECRCLRWRMRSCCGFTGACAMTQA